MRRLYALLVAGTALLLASTAFTDPAPTAAIALGRQLFFDPILSADQTISCASCHKEQFAFADTAVLSAGVAGRHGRRNTPSAMNTRFQATLFWDGRATTLEEQALIPVANPLEMDLPIAVAVARLNQSVTYQAAFHRVFGEAPSARTLAKALAEFERSLETSESPHDDWRLNDNEAAVSASAKRGFALFNGKAGCVRCHFGADFNNVEFRNIGLYDGQALADSGRAAITRQASDLGKFKIGPLRNVALTAPYMHNGMFKTLRQVIDYYNDPDKVVPHARNRDPFLAQPLGLTTPEKVDLENFLRALTDKRFLTRKPLTTLPKTRKRQSTGSNHRL
jgi:cytochrome c peroxidase